MFENSTEKLYLRAGHFEKSTAITLVHAIICTYIFTYICIHIFIRKKPQKCTEFRVFINHNRYKPNQLNQKRQIYTCI